MSSLALTGLVTTSNRSSRSRLIGIGAGVMVGVALLLLLLSASQAFGERSVRSTWTELERENPILITSADQELAADEAAVLSAQDQFHDQLIRTMTIATADDPTIRIPGVETVPGAGEYVASPALQDLIASVPADQLQDRYGTPIGSIDADALEGPDSLVIVVGASIEHVATADPSLGPQIVTGFTGFDYSSRSYRIIALIGAIAVLIPVLLLIGIVTDLGAAQRAERFATLRLIGATPGQVARIAAAETAVTTLIGAVLGIGLYLTIIPPAAQLRIGSSRFYSGDLLTTPPVMLIVVGVTVLAATGVAWWRIRRAGIGPLGAAREQRERRTRTVALLPLGLGLAALGAGVYAYNNDVRDQLTGLALIGGFVLTAVGLLLAGPVLTAWAARIGARRATTAAQVIGYNRIVQHPRASFRAVAGLVIAVYTVTVFSVAITAAAGVMSLTDDPGDLSVMTLHLVTPGGVDSETGSTAARIADTPGVTSVAIGGLDEDDRVVLSQADAAALGVLPTDSDTGYVSTDPGWLYDGPANPQPAQHSDVTATDRRVVLVATDGTPAAIERARTALITSGLGLGNAPLTRADIATATASTMENQYVALAYAGILIAAAISTISLAVSTLAALISRQRVFGLLKLTGMPRRTLRSIISYETILPVATVLLASIGIGVFTAWALITGLSRRTLAWPDPGYYLILVACIALMGLAIIFTTRAATRMLRTTATRFE